MLLPDAGKDETLYRTCTKKVEDVVVVQGNVRVICSALRVRHRWKYFVQGSLVILLITVVGVALTNLYGRNVFATDSRPNVPTPDVTKSHVKSNIVVTLQEMYTTQLAKPKPIPTIFAITPTRRRLTQLLDLTTLCQTLMNVKNLLWIVVESTFKKTTVVSDVLDSCKVNSVHLLSSMFNILTNTTHNYQSVNHALKRGAKEKNMGLEWLRKRCSQPGLCSGAVYFLDDESKYDLRLFEQIRQTQYVGVWPVAFAGKAKLQGPICLNGSIVDWLNLYATTLPFPISSLGFTVNLSCILNSKALFGYKPNSRNKSLAGWEESDFLRNFLTDNLDPKLECRGSYKEAYVWQVVSLINPRLRKHTEHWKYKLRT